MPVVLPYSAPYASAANLTLESLRDELRARLGFAAAGAAAGVNQTILNSILRLAQKLLYEAHDWAHMRRYEDKTLGMHQTLLDYPASANRERIKAVSVLRSGVWSPPLKRGITPTMYTTQDNYSWPQRWEPYEQIELWPSSDQQYTVRIFYIKQLYRFEQDQDSCEIDRDLILTVAIARAKAHYRQPDAPAHEKDAEMLLNRLRARSWGKSVFNPNDFVEENPLVKPVVV